MGRGDSKKFVKDCQAILVRTALLTREVLKEAPGLKVISKYGVGLDNIDLEYCLEHGIQVTNLPESNTVSVAEHTIGMILSITKNFTLCDRETRRGNFDARHQHQGIELEGKTLGVVGGSLRTWRALQEKPSAGWPSTLPRRSSLSQGVTNLGGRLTWRVRKAKVDGVGPPLRVQPNAR